MAKKTGKASKSLTKAAKKGLTKPKVASFRDRLPANEIEYKCLLIAMTEKHLYMAGGGIDTVMRDQAIRLRKELAILKAK